MIQGMNQYLGVVIKSVTYHVQPNATADSKPTLTLTVSTDGAEMSFNGWDSNIAAPLYVYDAGGKSVLHREAWRGETVSISALAKGVYVVKAGEHTAKFRK